MLITPMLASAGRSGPALAALAGTHLFDLKLDGVRAVLYCVDGQVELRNRNGVDITHRYPDVVAQFGTDVPDCILDGEIVAHDHSFESIALRDRQVKPASIARLTKEIPAKFIAFDLLQAPPPHADITYLPFVARREALERFHEGHPGRFQVTVCTDTPALFELCQETGREGIIAKRKTSTYQPGRRSPDWIKFKCVHRVSCVPVGYEAGTGSRSHFGAMHLAMIGDSGPVVVGRVGTGFDAREIAELKGRLDRRELFVVEIECTNQTKNGQLRFPVFKGIRSDLTPADATTVQLANLPTC